jgi:hypothetical protein
VTLHKTPSLEAQSKAVTVQAREHPLSVARPAVDTGSRASDSQVDWDLSPRHR